MCSEFPKAESKRTKNKQGKKTAKVKFLEVEWKVIETKTALIMWR